MEKFLSLPKEKQDIIADAAMSLFGAVGYKKASVADIADAAGISKAMVFYYFGSKKALYLFLIEFAGDIIKCEIDSRFDMSITDFFDKIRLATEIKMAALKKYPGILAFLTAMYYEDDPEIADDIRKVISEGEAFGAAFVFENMDTSKFKDDIDPALVLQILTYYAEGYMSRASTRSVAEIDTLLEDFYRCMELLRKHFYRAEFV